MVDTDFVIKKTKSLISGVTKWVKLTKGHLSLQLRIDFCLNIPKAYHKIVAFDKDSKRSGWRSSRGGNSANVVLAGRGGGGRER